MNEISHDTTHALRPTLAAYLLVLAILAIAWPSPSLVAGDFATKELTAAGVSLLLLVPLALWLAWSRALPVRGFLWLFAALLLPVNFHTPSDSLEADRATITFLVALSAATGAASLNAAGKELVVRVLVVSSLLLLVPALLEGGPGWGGVLGNSGELSGAALPGALAGLALAGRASATRGSGVRRWIGVAATLVFLTHALLAPVIAGLAVFAFVALAAALLGRRAGVRYRVLCASLFVIAVAGLGWLKLHAVATPVSSKAEASAANTTTSSSVSPSVAEPTIGGGLEVRRRIWRASLDLFLDHLWLGVGPGQFAVAFPTHRDPVERELSNWNRKIEQTTEVENPHNDWILPWTEGGLFAGVCWWVFLLGIGAAALSALRKGDALVLALGASSLGVLVAAGLNAPLLYNPIASLSAFALFGMLSGATAGRARGDTRRWSAKALLTPGFCLLLLLHVPRAYGMWRHGSALAELSTTTSTTAQALSVEKALESCPDSVVARSLEARVLEARGDLDGALKSWGRVLQLRPQRFEARVQSGVVFARLGRLSEAQHAFDAALEIDPDHPPLLRNRVRCYAESGRIEEALAEIERLNELGHYQAVWLRDLGCELILRGMILEALPLLARADKRFADLTGEQAWALEEELRRSGSAQAADAFQALAYFTWARIQSEDQDWADARRSYFQALRIMRDYVRPAGPARVRMEHAAALWQSGQREEARESLEGVEPRSNDWIALPAWAGETLFIMGFGVSRE